MSEQPAVDAIETPAENSPAPSAKVEEVAVSSSSERGKILSVKVCTNPTVFRIEYTSHDELYRLFQEKLQGLGIPPDHVYWLDTMTGERIRVNKDIAEASFFNNWMNLVELYSPVRPKKQRSTSSRRHLQNPTARHCFPDFSSSCSDECVHLRDQFKQLHYPAYSDPFYHHCFRCNRLAKCSYCDPAFLMSLDPIVPEHECCHCKFYGRWGYM